LKVFSRPTRIFVCYARTNQCWWALSRPSWTDNFSNAPSLFYS
jgi:hypothetical protein